VLVRIVWCLFFIALTIYAPIELSRLIIIYRVTLELLFELILFWSLWVVSVILFMLAKRGAGK